MGMQCDATILLVSDAVSPDRLSELLPEVASERVALVYSEADGDAVELGRKAAERLGVPHRTEARLDAEAVAGLADEHRGETVLVVAPSATEFARLQLGDGDLRVDAR